MDIHDKLAELQLLFDISQLLDASSNLSEILDSVLEVMARRTGMMRGVITLLDESSGEIAIEAAYGLTAEARNRGRYRIGEGVTGRVIRSGQPIIVPDVSADPLFLNRTESRNLQHEDIAFVCVPIKLEGEVIGALSADRLFSAAGGLEEDMRLLSVVASLVARTVKTRLTIRHRHHAVLEENRRLQQVLREQLRPERFVGVSEALTAVRAQIAQVAPTDATVLILGESGTGKELAADTIHDRSLRAGRPLIKVNCAALPEALVESELFGHEKGAFTGASSLHKGRFELAHEGTLFLDEIGDLSGSVQVKLLRVLQEREFQRVGGTQTHKVNVRLIAATSRNLERMVAEGRFRKDLYYRLNVFPLFMPPLRERRDDIPLLAARFLEKYSRKNGKPVPRPDEEAAALLYRYDWPGNIRELENVMERAVILADGKSIRAGDLPALLQDEALPEPGENLPQALERLERAYIARALQAHQGNMGKAAAALGITERVMGLRMKKFGLSYKAFRHAEKRREQEKIPECRF